MRKFIFQEGKERKFVKRVEQITFSANTALKNDKKVHKSSWRSMTGRFFTLRRDVYSN